ncbi:hypothetical protein IIU_05071 [Bacillus cereus VD133]|uniref:Uncharacterized protein n=1 Tax=Bacillus cereus VD133 TaxID=1053233 RepID=A0A9W5PN56_BACCE|nr:hypothetical protein [Bacillus cereus]EOO30754.1 hypothetical protein IIU_05071 [Bacillus cereus VD133]
MENMRIAINAKIKGLERAKELLEELNSLQLELVVESPKEIEGNTPINLEVTLDGRAIAEATYGADCASKHNINRNIERALTICRFAEQQGWSEDELIEVIRLLNSNTQDKLLGL